MTAAPPPTALGVLRPNGLRCRQGDTIETTMGNGSAMRITCSSPEACAEANRLIATGRWRVADVQRAASKVALHVEEDKAEL